MNRLHDIIAEIKPACAHAFEAWAMADDTAKNFTGQFCGDIGKLLDEYFAIQRKLSAMTEAKAND
jgi:hypothetical protein